MEKESENTEMGMVKIDKPSHAVAQHDPHMEWAIIKEQAKMLVKSGMLPVGIKTPEAAIAIMLAGKEYGLGPMKAFQNIYFIKGNISMSPRMKFGLARRSGLIAKFTLKEGPGWAEATVTRRDDGQVYSIKYTIDMAKRAGLAGKDIWKCYPENMLRTRAIGYVLDLAVPEIVGGLYSPEELDMPVDASGAMIEAEILDTKGTKATEAHSTPAQTQPIDVTAFNANEKKMNDIKSMWAFAKNMGINESEMREFILNRWGAVSTKDLTEAQINDWKDIASTAQNKEQYLAHGAKTSTPDQAEVPVVEGQVVDEDDAVVGFDENTGEIVYAGSETGKTVVTSAIAPPGVAGAQGVTKTAFPNI
jgi:hypothetical protein